MGMSVEVGQSSKQPQPATRQASPVAPPRWQPVVQAAHQATATLGDLIKQFWGVPVRVTLLSVSTQSHYYWRLDDFHVSQLMLGQPDEGQNPDAKTALIRLSDTCCAALLNRVLGARPSTQKLFDFKQLSPLEATVLNEFSRDLLAGFMKSLIKKPHRPAKGDLLHLVWVMQLEDSLQPAGENQPLRFKEPVELGKIILSLPPNAIRLEAPPDEPEPVEPIDDAFFYHVQAPVRIRLGSTRIMLSDLNQLEPDDLVVLENSQADRMAVIEPASGEALAFTADIRNPQSITIPYTQEMAMMETQQTASARQNLWDNLMIEVNAEFEPIKLPLKQLKQMSEGLVVEMGDLVHNRIALQVEGKTLAWGELIIVGDKFGVRVSQVEAGESAETDETASAGKRAAAIPEKSGAQASARQPDESTGKPPAGADNEENLDNFLNDDFDELDDAFDEKEEWQ